MDVYSTDEEKVEQLKTWWKDNGRSLIVGVVIGLAAVFGWRAWTDYSANQTEQASNAYAALMVALAQNDTQAAIAEGEQIIGKFSDTPYAPLSALAVARLRLAQGEPDAARSELQWAMKHTDMAGLRHLARLRLGRVMLSQGDDAAALALISGVKQHGFAAQYEELRGDILVKQGKPKEAREAYAKALAGLPPGTGARTLLQMKLDDLAGADRQEKS